MKFFFDWLTGIFSSPKLDESLPDPELPQRIRKQIRRTVNYSSYLIVDSQAAATEAIKDKARLVIVGTKQKPKSLLMLCPCGCQELLRINLSPAQGKAWRVNYLSDTSMSLYPSVDLDQRCRAHFIVRDNNALVL
jgi:hypothetical protein